MLRTRRRRAPAGCRGRLDPRGTTPRLHTKYRDMERAETPWETGRRESTRRKHTGVNHLAPITKYSRFFGAGKPAAWKN